MQESEFNRATFEVAGSMDISGRATADEMNRGLRTGKAGSFWRIPSRTFLGSLMVASLLVALAPLPTMAGEDERGRQGEDERTGHKEIEALEAKVASLQASVSALQGQVTTLQNQLANAKTSWRLTHLSASIPTRKLAWPGPRRF